MECVCLLDYHPWRLWEKWLYRTTSALENAGPFFSWSCAAPPILLPLPACQVHHKALRAQLHQPGHGGQGGDAGGGMSVHGEDRTSAWLPRTGWLSGRISCPRSLYPRIFNIKKKKKSYFTIIRKITDYSVWNVKWVYNILRERWFTK